MTIIEVRNKQVKLAITAPAAVSVDRAEVRQRQPAPAADQVLASQAARERAAL